MNAFMQNTLPPDFSNSEVSITTGVKLFLGKDPAEDSGQPRGDEAAVYDDPVPHELPRFIAGEFVDSFPAAANCVQRLRGECSGVDQRGVVVQRAETSIEVIAVVVQRAGAGSTGKPNSRMAAANLSTPPRVERKP